jgi:uncharacterized protein (TIGR03083 family)
VSRDEVLGLYHDGVQGVGTVVRGWTAQDWQRSACGSWSAEQLAGHLLCVVRWYHQWLDRALVGESNPPFRVDEIPACNDRALDELETAAPIERTAQFQEQAERYAQRLADSWDLPYGYPYGTVTAGLHAGAAAAEWHLHAWDLATAVGADHRPGDPAALFEMTATCMLTARGGLPARLTIPILPTLALRDPWGQLLRRSGRRR